MVKVAGAGSLSTTSQKKVLAGRVTGKLPRQSARQSQEKRDYRPLSVVVIVFRF